MRIEWKIIRLQWQSNGGAVGKHQGGIRKSCTGGVLGGTGAVVFLFHFPLFVFSNFECVSV